MIVRDVNEKKLTALRMRRGGRQSVQLLFKEPPMRSTNAISRTTLDVI